MRARSAIPSPGGRSPTQAAFSARTGSSASADDAIALAGPGEKCAPEAQSLHPAALTDPSGFLGADGIFRFGENGLIERGLAVLEVTRRGFRVVDPPRTSFDIGTN